jgi:hypothetical protein
MTKIYQHLNSLIKLDGLEEVTKHISNLSIVYSSLIKKKKIKGEIVLIREFYRYGKSIGYVVKES